MSADLHGLGALDAERAALTLPGTIPALVAALLAAPPVTPRPQ